MVDKHPDHEQNPRVRALLAAARSLHDAVRPQDRPMAGHVETESGHDA